MKRKGFTLIELLAVIVVLAIIALIATPIVMNVIKNAGMGAAERSADNYVKAVETLIATEKLDGNSIADGEYTIGTDGNLTFGSVEVSGTKPNGGTIKIENGQVVKNESSIKVGDYTVTYKDGMAEAEEGKKLMTLADCGLVDGTANTIGAKYTCDLGAGEKTFYVLEAGTNSKAATLILEGLYDAQTLTWCASGSDTSCAADGLAAKLDEIALAWKKLDRSQIGIPSASQIVSADAKAVDEYEKEGYLSLEKEWLYNVSHEQWCYMVLAYWTSTPAKSQDNARVVLCYGGLTDGVTNHSDFAGVRPTVQLEV